MEHFITSIEIRNVRHLKDITIQLDENERKHLILTGPNGSGKTSLLEAIRDFVNQATLKVETFSPKRPKGLDEAILKELREFPAYLYLTEGLSGWDAYCNGEFITAYYPAERKARIVRAKGVVNIVLEERYPMIGDGSLSSLLIRYMVHLKTQQSYANNEGDEKTVTLIQSWFDRFERALRRLLDDDSVSLRYDYKNYNFLIEQNGRNPVGFDQLSDGYSAIIQIVTDLMLRMDHNWLQGNSISTYDVEGIALIDELETHLHIELQRKILPFLTEFFPRIQFIVTTHSPYILNSVSNAVIYDLDRRERYDDFSSYSADEVAEAYFGAENYSDKLESAMKRYKELCAKDEPTEDERAERAELRLKLKNVSGELAPRIAAEMEQFEDARARQ